jgi:hypothetical protein
MSAEEIRLWLFVYTAVVGISKDWDTGRSQEAKYQADKAVENFRQALEKFK